MDIILKGGKTPSRLLADLDLYNPQNLPPSNYNVLTDLPVYTDQGPHPVLVLKKACRHRWFIKPNQSSVNIGGAGSTTAGTRQVAAYCTQCRCHLTVLLECRESAGSKPCPQPAVPLHHFVAVPQASKGFRRNDNGRMDDWEDSRVFRCSMEACPAKATIAIRSARLRPEWVELLVNQDLIDKRAEAAKATDVERFQGHANPSASVVLTQLRQYIMNAVKGDDFRRINASNKKWMLAFGDPCSELLHFLGFSYHGEEWSPPQPEKSAPVPYQNDLNVLLDDVDKELVNLASKHTGPGGPGTVQLPVQSLAHDHFERLLGCKDYPKRPGYEVTDQDEHPFYAGLGTVADFHDDLIIFAYDQQLSSDVDNTPYYLECLQTLATGRNSESLQEKAVIESSLEKVSLTEIREAYTQLNLDRRENLSEDYIIGMFDSRVSDAAKHQEPMLKRALTIIGTDRRSERIKNHASDTIATYEQALTWLGATADMDESFITNMYGVKINENESNKEIADKCIKVIAEARNSESLKMFASTGMLHDFEMDVAQAYARLNVGDRSVDDSMILASYQSGCTDAPSQTRDLTRALRAIGKDRASQFLLGVADANSNMAGYGQARPDWPVGLENIGNTCYLNSILQCYFSFTGVRDLVLHFAGSQMSLKDFESKRVNATVVFAKDVLRSQEFVEELAKLFEDMIHSNSQQVTPSAQLARLTLSPAAEQTTTAQPLVDTTGQPLLQTAASTAVNIDSTIAESNGGPQTTSPVSEGTLVDISDQAEMVLDAAEEEKQREALEDKENLAPMKMAPHARHSTPEPELVPLVSSSPSRLNEQPSVAPAHVEQKEAIDIHEDVAVDKSAPVAPSRPPPVPPREKPKTAVQEAETYARQQDVTEVMGNVTFQLQTALRPLSFDANGEQVDEIKNLLWGSLKTITIDKQGKSRSKEEYFFDLKVNVHEGPSDLYSAIDASLDKQLVDVGTSQENQYATISRLPPVLQIYINRIAYDKTRGTIKIHNHLAFEPVIYMDRFMDTDDADLIRRREESWKLKAQLREIEARQTYLRETRHNTDMSNVLKLTADILSNIDEAAGGSPSSPPAEVAQMKQVASDVEKELEDMKQRQAAIRDQLSLLWSGLSTKLAYRLHAVFIHRGMASSGHYWIYIYDFVAGIWRKYNDSYVTQVNDPETEIYDQEPGDRPATPTFIVYIKEGMEADLVEAVRREPVAEPMTDVQRGAGVQAWQDFAAANAGLGENAGHGHSTTRVGGSQQLREDIWQGQSLLGRHPPSPDPA